MPLSVMQNSFTGGEWAPVLYSRTKLRKYFSAVRTMLNFFIHPHGPASNRPGFKYINYTKDPTDITRLIPFSFSIIQTYVLEFGDQYMRVFKDGAPVVLADKAIIGATQANPLVIETAAAHDYNIGDTIIISGVEGMTELNGGTFIVGSITTTTFELINPLGTAEVDGTGYGAYSSGGVSNEIYEIVTPYTHNNLPLLNYEQSADVLYLNHPGFPERQLTRTAHDNWTMVPTTFGSSAAAPTGFIRSVGSETGHFYGVTAVFSGGVESIISNTVAGGPGDTFAWPSVAGAEYYNFYDAENGVFGWLGYVSTDFRVFTVPLAFLPDTSIAPPTLSTPFGTTGNYPGVGAFFEQRFLRARTNNGPQTIWGSVIGDYANLNSSVPLKDDDAYEFTINSQQVNEIKWIVPLRVLLIGTAGGVYQMGPGGGVAITPTNVNIGRQTSIGSSGVFPIVINNNILFIEFGGERVRDLLYSLEEDGYTGNDLTILVPHLFKGNPLTDWCYQRSPDSIVWCIREDGSLVGMTYYREHQVFGWHRHTTQGTFESIACITSASGVDEVYVIVTRVIDGVTKKFVEKLETRLPNDDIKDAYFVDSGLSLDDPKAIGVMRSEDPVEIIALTHGFATGDLVDIVEAEGMTEVNNLRFKIVVITPNSFTLQDQQGVDIDGTAFGTYVPASGKVRKAVTEVSGLFHLEGAAVAVLADGNVVPNITVANGSITLAEPASRVHVGLGYTCDLETLDFEFPTESGNTVQDKRRNITSVLLGLENTREVFVGPSADRLVEVPLRTEEPYDDPIALVTGDREVLVNPGEEREARVFIRVTSPVPITVNKIVARVDYGES